MRQPPQGLTTVCKLVKVIDGDTVEVAVERRLKVRLLDCWAPETRTRNADEKLAGLESKEHLQGVLEGSEITLHVPADSQNIDDRMSFGRVLGRLFVSGVDVSELQVRAGHAKQSKQ